MALRDVARLRAAVAVVALALGAACLIAAATALYAQTAGAPDPAELAARERHLWPGIIPVAFLALVVAYAIGVAARRRGRRRGSLGPPSTQDPPPLHPDRPRDRASR